MTDLKATSSLYDITRDIKDINTMLVTRQLLDRLEAAEKDAARYRYLRESNCVTGKGVGSSVKSGWFVNLSYESLDAAIDAAMKEQK